MKLLFTTPNNLELLHMLSRQFRYRLNTGRRCKLCSSVSSPFGGWLGWLGLDRHLQLFSNLVMLANVTCKARPPPPPLPPLAQAQLRSQKFRQNSGSTPTLCVDKPVLARGAHNSKARYVTATPGIAMLAMAQNHIKTNRMGLQCVAQCCYEQNAHLQT